MFEGKRIVVLLFSTMGFLLSPVWASDPQGDGQRAPASLYLSLMRDTRKQLQPAQPDSLARSFGTSVASVQPPPAPASPARLPEMMPRAAIPWAADSSAPLFFLK